MSPGSGPPCRTAEYGFSSNPHRLLFISFADMPELREKLAVYKEFAVEAVVWLIPVVVLLGLAFMITST